MPVYMLENTVVGVHEPLSLPVYSRLSPLFMVDPLLTYVSFYKIKYLLNIHGSGNESKFE